MFELVATTRKNHKYKKKLFEGTFTKKWKNAKFKFNF